MHNGTDVGVESWSVSGETLLQKKKTPLVVGGIQTQVLADSMVIAAGY